MIRRLVPLAALAAAGCATVPAGLPGEGWHLQAGATAAAALYGPPDSEARFAIRCEADRRRIALVLVDPATTGTLRIRAGRTTAELPARHDSDGMPTLTAELAPDAPILDALIAAPRFEAGGLPLPGDPAVARVIKSCRRAR